MIYDKDYLIALQEMLLDEEKSTQIARKKINAKKKEVSKKEQVKKVQKKKSKLRKEKPCELDIVDTSPKQADVDETGAIKNVKNMISSPQRKDKRDTNYNHSKLL